MGPNFVSIGGQKYRYQPIPIFIEFGEHLAAAQRSMQQTPTDCASFCDLKSFI